MISIKGIYSAGQPGQFRANADMIGWKGDSGGDPIVHPSTTVKRAEWLEGKLRVLCTDEEGQEQVLGLEGFKANDFDTLWRHFEQTCGVYIKKHRPAASLSEANFDAAMRSMETASDQVDEAVSGSVQKKAKEADLLKKVEGVRDGLEEAVKGDKQALSRVFAANGCERIGKLRLVLDTVQLEVYHKDQRWIHLRNMARTIEGVLRDIGSFRLWKPTEGAGGADASMMRRQMMWELRKRQGAEDMLGDEWDGDEAEVEEEKPKASAVSDLAKKLQGTGFNPLMPGPLQPNPDPLSGGYGGSREPPLPQPPPEPEEEEEYEEEEDPVDEILPPGTEDLTKYEDEEVTNPLLQPAAPPGHENDMGLGRTEEQRRMHYTRSDSVLEGWVWKRSRFLKKWRRRWLVLTKNALESLKQRGGVKPTESVEAGSVHRVYSADGEVQMARCFCVVGNKRSFFMVCDDEAQKAEWIRQVSNILGTRRY